MARDLVAACGDVGLTLFAFWFGVVWTKNKRWTWPGSPKTYAALAALGCVSAIIAERLALRFGERTYTEIMPVIPGLEVGVPPIVQLAVLMPLAFAFANVRQHRKNTRQLAQNRA